MARARMGNPTHTIVSGRPISSSVARTTNQRRPKGRLESKKSAESKTRPRRRARSPPPWPKPPSCPRISSAWFTASLLSHSLLGAPRPAPLDPFLAEGGGAGARRSVSASWGGFSPSRLPYGLRSRLPCRREIAAPGAADGGGGNAAKFPHRFVVEELGPVAEPPAGRRDDRQGRHGEADHARPAQGRVGRVQGGEHGEQQHRREVVVAHVDQHDQGEAPPGLVEDPGDDDAEQEAEEHEREDVARVRTPILTPPVGQEQGEVPPGPQHPEDQGAHEGSLLPLVAYQGEVTPPGLLRQTGGEHLQHEERQVGEQRTQGGETWTGGRPGRHHQGAGHEERRDAHQGEHVPPPADVPPEQSSPQAAEARPPLGDGRNDERRPQRPEVRAEEYAG